MDGREVLKTLVTLLEEQEQITIKYTIEEVRDDKGGGLNGKTL